jgi:hypothetical protein
MEDSAFWGLGPGALGGLLALGAFHGINPAMGWLFAVALGLQEQSSRAVAWALIPIAFGHALAIGATVLAAVAAGAVVPLFSIRLGAAAILFGFGIYCLLRRRHPRWGGMRVGFRDLTIWSFLMASAHGAGFMLLPFLLQGSSASLGHAHHSAGSALQTPVASVAAVVLHTGAYLAVTGLTAWLIYAKVGLAVLRKAWINLDWIWALALMVTGLFTLMSR